ncbi:exonuclease domain-containing protein [uncultured Eudoraea sp.]|uniref:exonuclease domain-containing protein n=1 Tax=uncultured Eudoraea sp. TaxID=1035614 RepID=UPI002627E742|nr:exonuclease domain-containing protein [uncultured Eudoraea sp.]
MYAILDIETTGGKYNEEGITEIAIHKFDGHEVVDKFISLVNPEKEIQPFVVKLTGINNKMLRTAPKFHEVAKRIVEITENAVLVAHNAQFDYRILRTEFRRLGYDFERKTLCTVDLSKKLIPDAASHSLGKLVRSLGIPVSDRHRANGDALATLKLFKLLLTKDSDKSIIKEIVREESLGELTQRQLDIVESMPTEVGVYYMYNKDGEIIFLGKSNNIKKRVNRHFLKSGEIGRQIQKETKKVTYEKTGNELVALLKENEELIKNKPKYNTRNTPVNSSKKKQRIQINGYKSLSNSLIIVDKGREIGERSAILIKNGFFHGLGYYNLNYQINNIHILESIITPMESSGYTRKIIESYLRDKRVQEIIELKDYE